MTPYEKLINAVADAIGELEAEHRPEPAVKGRILGCVQCWPKDGSWPCVSRMVADDLREALEATP